VIQIERVEAVQFNKVMTAGRTKPLLLTCERTDGSMMDAVVKFATGHECTVGSLCAELIAAQLAVDLGLPTPTPVVVTWGQAFANSIVDAEARGIITSSSPPAFGSTLITGGAGTWPADRKLIGEVVRQTALAIFFFDAMIGNSDRRGIKPNILVLGDNFRLIDHEMAFRDYMLIVRPTLPWELGGLNGLVTPGAHIFAAELSKVATNSTGVPSGRHGRPCQTARSRTM
jgi:hypothetical protein